ncbi:MAG: SUMF1/EgtB/PvdO family nonheme iron enzyme [Pyrinomonadaceae bacterium]
MISIRGGTFQMGTNDVPANSKVTFDLVLWPAHSVTVKDFMLQKTEVTNAAYQEFVKSSGHSPPEDWVSGEPAGDQELWPVRNVSQDDALAYAAWRSKQDGVRYRLPTEQEWEYARATVAAQNFTRGAMRWVDGRANVDAGSPKIVGSYPQGANQWGVA